MYKAYLVTCDEKPVKAYVKEGFAKRAVSHFEKYNRRGGKYEIIELEPKSAGDVSLAEISLRNGMQKTGNALTPLLAISRSVTDLVDLLAEATRTKKVTPLAQKLVNDRLASILVNFTAFLVETGIPAQPLINYAGGKL